jgi:xylulokinase
VKNLKKGKILVYDYGTTSIKTVLFDEELNIIDKVTKELTYEYPQEEYIEIEAEKYWDMLIEATQMILDKNDCRDSLEVISVTSQAETLIPIDIDGKPLRKAIVWLDERAKDECIKLRKRVDINTFYAHTGLSNIDPILPLSKIMWIKIHENDIYRNTYKFLLLRDFIINRLSDEIVSDFSVASCTGYFDIRRKNWWIDILDLAEIDKDKLPEVTDPTCCIGYLKKEVKSILGLTKDIKIINGMLDQCASAIGAGNIETGILTETTGTAMVLAFTIDSLEELKVEDKIPVVYHAIPNKYLLLPYSPTAGIVLKWFKDNFCSEEIHLAQVQNKDVYQVIDKIVEERKVIRPELIILPYFCGTITPVNNPNVRGAIFGLDLKTTKSDIIKAIMEGVGFMVREHADFLSSKGFRIDKIVSLGGGARSDIWLQIKSDILNRKLTTLENEESASFGCALVAAVAINFIKDFNAVKKMIKVRQEFVPNSENVSVYDKKYKLYLQLYKRFSP